MIKNEKLIIENFFGLTYNGQKKIYELLINTLDVEEDDHIIGSLRSIFQCYLDDLKELYDTSDMGLKLKSFYVERMNNKNSTSIDNFMNAKNYATEEVYKEAFLFNIGQYTGGVIASLNKFFDVKYVDDVYANEFIENYEKASIYEKRRFIMDLIKSYYIVAYLPDHYLPGVNNIGNDFDNFILSVFGEGVFEKYNNLSPLSKIKFIRKYKYDIEEYYRLQNQHSEKDIKARRLKKRPHCPNHSHR